MSRNRHCDEQMSDCSSGQPSIDGYKDIFISLFRCPTLAPLSALFQALADPTRLRIVALLRAMELSVGELAQVLGQSQPRVSRHVRILGDAGLVERRKEGSWVFLTLADRRPREPLFALIDRWASPRRAGAVRRRCRPARGGPRRPRRRRGALFRRPCRGVGRHPLAPRRRKRGRAGDRRARSATSRSGACSTSAPAPGG